MTEVSYRMQQSNQQMIDVTGELFRSYCHELNVLTPIEGCFEHYGIGFIIDDQWNLYLLEVNPGPDFNQTGPCL
jgi:tubulin---tyrosine ligase